jgi:hypothetical protein
MILDIIGQIFWFGMLATPIIAFLCVRKWESGLNSKIIGGIAITFVLASIFFFISMIISFRDGLGPS